MKHIAFGLLAMLAVACGQASPSTLSCPDSNPFYGRTDGLCYDKTTKTPYLTGSGSTSVVPGSPTFTATFTEGAAKGLFLTQSDTTAFDGTAGTLNYLHYSGGLVAGIMTIVDAGTTVPAATATGLDLMAGTNNDNDHLEMFFGTFGTTGRPFTVGTDAAFQICGTFTITDVSDTDLMNVGFRDPVGTTVTAGSYTAYAAIGIGNTAGQIYVADITTGGTDTTQVWADGESHKVCTLVSAAGVVTYTIDGAAPTVTDAHTFSDGQLLIPFVAFRNNAATPDPFDLTKLEVSYQ